MSTAKDVADVLEELNYPSNREQNYESISLVEFSQVAEWISRQLQFFAKTDSIVQVIKDDTELASLNMELNSLFKEVDSSYSDSFTLDSVSERLSILHSLSGDLLAARLNYIRNQNDEDFSTTELNPRKDLGIINNCLSISYDMKDTKSYFQKIFEKLDKNLLKLHEEDSLLLPDKKTLTPQQWAELKKLNETFRQEYSIRREMLLRRADTTIDSFGWKNDSSRKVDQALLKDVYKKCRDKMTVAPCMTLANALAARSSDCNSLISDVISTSHASCLIEIPNVAGKANQGAQQRLQLHKYLIGSVPDRGGRPDEQPMPAKETFTQQQGQRESANNRRGGRRGGGSGGYQRDSNYHGNDQRGGSNYREPRNIPDQTNRVQNAGWQHGGGGFQGGQFDHQQRGGGGHSHHRQYQQPDNYSQYQGGHQRFTGYGQNYQDESYNQGRSRSGSGGGGGQYHTFSRY